MLGRLARRPASVGELAAALPVGRTAVSMHLPRAPRCRAGRGRAEATRRVYHLEPDALGALRDSLDWYWTQALETFKEHVQADGEHAMEPDMR